MRLPCRRRREKYQSKNGWNTTSKHLLFWHWKTGTNPGSPFAPLEPWRRGDVVFHSAVKALECVRLFRASLCFARNASSVWGACGPVGLLLRLCGAELRCGWLRGAPAASLPSPTVSTWCCCLPRCKTHLTKPNKICCTNARSTSPSFPYLFIFFIQTGLKKNITQVKYSTTLRQEKPKTIFFLASVY